MYTTVNMLTPIDCASKLTRIRLEIITTIK